MTHVRAPCGAMAPRSADAATTQGARSDSGTADVPAAAAQASTGRSALAATGAGTRAAGISEASSPIHRRSPALPAPPPAPSRSSSPAGFAPQQTMEGGAAGVGASSPTCMAAHACAKPADTWSAPLPGRLAQAEPSSAKATGAWLLTPSCPALLSPQHLTRPPPRATFSTAVRRSSTQPAGAPPPDAPPSPPAAGEAAPTGGPETAHVKVAPTETEWTKG
mmetsp:Transcript_18650/g.59008  ORF Transcript_18650/g.59008 Transcript_18650/m.59008 type:complete len:221 (+) Transcript_18650:697-1359(+)